MTLHCVCRKVVSSFDYIHYSNRLLPNMCIVQNIFVIFKLPNSYPWDTEKCISYRIHVYISDSIGQLFRSIWDFEKWFY